MFLEANIAAPIFWKAPAPVWNISRNTPAIARCLQQHADGNLQMGTWRGISPEEPKNRGAGWPPSVETAYYLATLPQLPAETNRHLQDAWGDGAAGGRPCGRVPQPREGGVL